MIEQSPLERRYRKLLALYPKSFRTEHEEEMVAVLMQGAGRDQSRPRAVEAADLATHGMRRRARRRFPSDWERSHAAVMFPVRILIALWLCVLTVLLVSSHHGELWLVLIVPSIVLHLYIAYQIRPALTAQ